jgi:hypothetical protein
MSFFYRRSAIVWRYEFESDFCIRETNELWNYNRHDVSFEFKIYLQLLSVVVYSTWSENMYPTGIAHASSKKHNKYWSVVSFRNYTSISNIICSKFTAPGVTSKKDKFPLDAQLLLLFAHSSFWRTFAAHSFCILFVVTCTVYLFGKSVRIAFVFGPPQVLLPVPGTWREQNYRYEYQLKTKLNHLVKLNRIFWKMWKCTQKIL